MPARSSMAILRESILSFLVFAAVDRFHVKGMTEDEGDAFALGTEIGQPVPGEDALDGDDEVVAIGRDDLQKRFGVRGQVLVDQNLAVAVEDADVHRFRVQIDAAVVAMLVRVESHWFSPCADARVSIGIQPTPGGVGAGRGLG